MTGLTLFGDSIRWERRSERRDVLEIRPSIVQIGFPIMIKATAGGGGRGMRLAQHKDEYISLLRAATQEALGAFGNGAVYLERLPPSSSLSCSQKNQLKSKQTIQ
jgi:acetyl/propionyl-CoA carboxylase alpha subunit